MKRFGVTLDQDKYKALFRTYREARSYVWNVLNIRTDCDKYIHELNFTCQACVSWYANEESEFVEMTFHRGEKISHQINFDCFKRFWLWYDLGGDDILGQAVEYDAKMVMTQLADETAEIWSELTQSESRMFQDDIADCLTFVYGEFAKLAKDEDIFAKEVEEAQKTETNKEE